MEINNRKARYSYEILEVFEAGIVLQGTEIKSIRSGSMTINDSYAIIRGNEIWLLNSHIAEYKQGNIFNHEPTRNRKLLLHKSQIKKLKLETEKDGRTLIPLKVYLSHGIAKVSLGLCVGKKNYDKKQAIKERDIDRYIKKEYKY